MVLHGLPTAQTDLKVRPSAPEAATPTDRRGKNTANDADPNGRATARTEVRLHLREGLLRVALRRATIEMTRARRDPHPGHTARLAWITKTGHLRTGVSGALLPDRQQEAPAYRTVRVRPVRARGLRGLLHARRGLRQVALHDRRADGDLQIAGHNVALRQEKEEDLPRGVAERLVIALPFRDNQVRVHETLVGVF